MRTIPPAEEKKLRQDVMREASSLRRSIILQAYIGGYFERPSGAGRAAFGIERAVTEYIEKSNGRGRMTLLAEMVAIRERKLSTIPPKNLAETEPLAEDIIVE